MSDVPIRRLMVSDFRRIEGTRDFPLDAPVVLIHGPNGTGKTSILSALELALTGGIRSMERQSDRYRAHLPFFGQPYATVRADVAEDLQAGTRGAPLTVSGARLEGTPAFSEVAAKFYAERCYLDQASLGRLLDLYQAREGSEQTALENFVNELLGLEKLDALRSGLVDANDLRLLKKLAVGVDEADRQAKVTEAQLKEQSAVLTEIRTEVVDARTATLEAIVGLDRRPDVGTTDERLLHLVAGALSDDTTPVQLAAAVKLHQELIALGGRISASVERPTPPRVAQTRAALAAAIAGKEAWEAADGVRVRAWEAAAEAAGVDLRNEPRVGIENATQIAVQEQDDAANARSQSESLGKQLDAERAELQVLQAHLTDAHEHSSALVETLAAARNAVEDSNKCPVCDRDFGEIGHLGLLSHIDAKLAELTTHGQQLVDLRNERDQLSAQVLRSEAERAQLEARFVPVNQLQAITQRRRTLVELAAQVGNIEAAKSRGAELSRIVGDLEEALDNVEAATVEESFLARELARYADLLQVRVSPTIDSFRTATSELLQQAQSRVAYLTDRADNYRKAEGEAARLQTALERESSVVQRLADIAERKKQWDDRLAEAKRRQGVAKEVHEAATLARTDIVHRVFTKSLNEVWKSVFTRLAPDEGFIPSFGIPSATKKTFDIQLETTHRDGQTSGPPQMMLSAGNLNTAALSLFLALHLAVEPLVPCLVFDDPVQAMDEVHVAQFAALVRLLAKRNGRQVIIAVHERELFEYLTLELSPAFNGDELITIELGERAMEEDGRVIRHRWTSDAAIAN